MGEIHIPSSKILICGIILSSKNKKDAILSSLEQDLGPIDEISKEKIFDDYSPYYEKEMGKDLKRFFLSFSKSFDPEKLASYKMLANEMENKLKRTPDTDKRSVNIDPGYLDLAKLVVASTKDASYRVYLKDGIYAQTMLYYMKNSFHPFEWTYIDYKDETFLSFFNHVREKYKKTQKKNN